MGEFCSWARVSVRGAWAAALVAMSAGASAQTLLNADGSLSVSGFGTVGATHVDAPAGWGFRRESNQAGKTAGWTADVDSRAGVQLNYAPDPRFEWVTQLMAVPRARFTPDNELLRWAFAALRPTPQLQFRLGRLSSDLMLMSTYRNVGFAYATVRPPVEVYGLVPSVVDGADVAQVWPTEQGRWRAALMLGQARAGQYDAGGPLRLRDMGWATLSYETPGLTVRTAWCSGRFSNNPQDAQPAIDSLNRVAALPVPQVASEAATLADALTTSGRHLGYFTLSVRHEAGLWQVQGEGMRVTGLPQGRLYGGYLQVGRRLDEVTVFSQVSQVKGTAALALQPQWQAALSPLIGAPAAAQAQQLASATATGLAAAGADQRTFSVGAAWAIDPKLMLKAQWDRVHATARGAAYWSPRGTQGVQANVLSLSADFVW